MTPREYVLWRNQRASRVSVSLPVNARGAYCQDDHCEIVCAHPPHVVVVRASDAEKPDADNDLDEITHLHLRERVVTPFNQLYGAVVNDYGEVADRTVWRSLHRLLATGRAVKITHPRNPRLGAYVRGGARLASFLPDLREQVEDCFTA